MKGKVTEFVKLVSVYRDDLDCLCKRLQNSYEGGDFEQNEEDRIALCAILDAFDEVEKGGD